jgi:hypothetical protein
LAGDRSRSRGHRDEERGKSCRTSEFKEIQRCELVLPTEFAFIHVYICLIMLIDVYVLYETAEADLWPFVACMRHCTAFWRPSLGNSMKWL